MALALMRRHRRWLYIFLWLVIAAFIILYIPAFQQEQSGTPGETIVSVGDSTISVGEFRRAFYRIRRNYDRLYGGRLDEPALRQVQQQVLESLVAQRIVELEAERLGISVSDEALVRAIATSPEFQDERGFIGTDEIRRRLELQGLNEEQLAESLRRELVREQLQNLVTSVADVSDAEIERELSSQTEQVRLEYVLVDAGRFHQNTQPGEDDIEAWFQANKGAYLVPEKRVVSYALLDPDALRPQVAVSDGEIATYYHDHREDFREEEEACASHILIKVRQGETGEGHAEVEARGMAQALLDRLRAGANFAALARESSEDPGSAQSGGDLGCFPPGRMIREFDDAVFGMEPGQTSGLVRTGFGYHIIRLASRRESSVPPLPQVQERIRAVLLDRKMNALAEEKAQLVAVALAGGDPLGVAAEAAGLSVRESTPFPKGEPPPELPSPELAARAFQLETGEAAKEPFPLSNGVAFMALAEIQPEHVPEFDEVRDEIRADLIAEASFAEARSLAARIESRARAVGLERAASEVALVRKETPQLVSRQQPLGELGSSHALDEGVFSLPGGTLSAPVRVSSGWAVVRVLERTTPDSAERAAQREKIRSSLLAQRRSGIFEAFLLAARERYTITRNAEAYRRAIGDEG